MQLSVITAFVLANGRDVAVGGQWVGEDVSRGRWPVAFVDAAGGRHDIRSAALPPHGRTLTDGFVLAEAAESISAIRGSLLEPVFPFR